MLWRVYGITTKMATVCFAELRNMMEGLESHTHSFHFLTLTLLWTEI